MEIRDPGVVVILGPNGSGKTTLIKCMLGMVLPQKGGVFYNDESVTRQWKYREMIGYLPQIAQFPDNLKVSELIGMIKNIRNQPAEAQYLIDQLGLGSVMGKMLSDLSGGTRQKVNIVLTFMYNSPVLILDEPTAGLDPVSLVFLKQLIQREKKAGNTLIITTHIMSLVEEIADEIVFLLDGKIYFRGSVVELLKQTNEYNLEHAIAKILKDDQNT